MSDSWDVEILTTCATDYATWKNAYAPGVSMERNVPIRRFRVDRVRDRARFERLSTKLARDPAAASAEDERAWMAAQGPACSGLTSYLDEHVASLDAVYFYSYLYATTYDNLRRVAAKAVLVSLAHDEWMLRLPMWDSIFAQARRIVALTPDEEHLLRSRFTSVPLSTTVIALGFDSSSASRARAPSPNLNIGAPFALYVGRIDPAKNCDELVRDFIDLAAAGIPVPQLVLAGPVSMPLPEHPQLRICGVLSDEQKRQWMAAAEFVVIPSTFESLSLVALESWGQGTAILVNGSSSVLVGQCRRSGGGVWYSNRDEFKAQYATRLQGESEALGRQGNAYVKRFYNWPDIVQRHRSMVLGLVPRCGTPKPM